MYETELLNPTSNEAPTTMLEGRNAYGATQVSNISAMKALIGKAKRDEDLVIL
jgi:hypothetical protein